jgi:hypothetical protein
MNPIYLVALNLVSSLVQYDDSLFGSGDISGFIASIYTHALGPYFSGALLVTIYSLSYIRTNELLYGSILWVLIGGSVEILVPSTGFSIFKLFIILGFGSGLYSLFRLRGKRI